MSEKELLQTMVMWSAIDKRDFEQLASVRAELAILSSREETRVSDLDVSLY